MTDGAGSALGGKVVFVSRSREEAVKLCDALESRGARVLALPLLQFALPEDVLPMDAALKNLCDFDWWLVTSQHAVGFAAARCRALGLSLAELAKGVHIGAVGAATAKAAAELGLAVEYTAKQQSAVGLARELADRVAGKRILLLRSNLAESALPAALSKNGAEVTDLIGYRTLPPSPEEEKRLATVAWESVDAAVFFSPSAIRHFVEAVSAEKMRTVAEHTLAVAVGPTTAEAAQRQGFGRCVTAEQPSAPAITRTLEEALTHRQSHKMTGVNRG